MHNTGRFFVSMKHRIGAQLGVKRVRRFATNLSWTLLGDLLHVFLKNVSVGLKLNAEISMQPWGPRTHKNGPTFHCKFLSEHATKHLFSIGVSDGIDPR